MLPSTSRTASPDLTASSSSSSFGGDDDPSEETLLSDEENDVSMERVVEILLNNLRLRPYQKALLNKSIEGNIVAVLPTGTGKTLIAASLIKHVLHQTVGEYPSAKRTVFLAPTRVLVEQQYKYIKRCIPNATIERLHGDHNVDNFSKSDWIKYFQKYQILLFTPDVLYTNLLKRAYISICDFNLIVFDEAHWALAKKEKSKHPYRKLLDYYKEKTQNLSPEESLPRIFGMTASLVNPKVPFEEIPETVKKFEQLYMADVASDDTTEYIKEAAVFIVLSSDFKYRKVLKRYPIEDGGAFDYKDAFTKTLEIFESFEGFDLAKDLKKAILKVRNLIITQERNHEHMGPWFAIEALKLFKGSMARLETQQIGSLIVDLFTYVQDYIEKLYRPPELATDADFALHGPISNKLTDLLKILVILQTLNSLNCIIFVTERIDANLLYRWLLLISESHPQYAFIKPGFICGSVAKDFIRFDKNTADFKEKFENGQLNVMIATAVLEEGIDVPICNAVIRYNFPPNFRAYTQSKGRARDSNSYFLLMVDPELEKTKNWEDLLRTYKRTEDYLKSLRGISEPTLAVESAGNDQGEDEGERLQTAEGADLYEKDALVYLHQYMQRLPADYFTEKKLNFSYVERAPKQEGGEDLSQARQSKYCAVFIMPINSSLTGGFVCGDYRSSIARAKDSCAFKVCKLLLERGEMDGHLKIITREFLLDKHIAELNLKVANRTKGEQFGRDLKKLPYERVTSKYSQAVRASLVATLQATLSPTSASLPPTRYHLYTIEFLRIPNTEAFFSRIGSSASVLANILNAGNANSNGCTVESKKSLATAFSSLKMGILCERELPSKQIDSIIYLNGKQLLVRIAHKQTSYYYPPDSTYLAKLQYYTNHLQQHVLVNSSRKLWSKKKEKEDKMDDDTESNFNTEVTSDTESTAEKENVDKSCCSLMDAIAPQMTNFFLVPVNHRKNSDQIHYKLIEDLYEWQKGMDLLHNGIGSPKSMTTVTSTFPKSAEQLVIDFPEKTIFACYHRHKLVLHYVKGISNVFPTDAFSLTQKITEFSKDGSPSAVKKEKVETVYDEYYRTRYGINLAGKEDPMIHAADLPSTIKALCRFGITFRIAKVDKELKKKHKAEKEAQKRESLNAAGEGEEAVNLEEVPKVEPYKLLFPAELARRYPLPYHYYVMLNAYPSVLYRLETFLIATEFLEERAEGHLPSGVHFTITDDERLPESLLTADSFTNQQEIDGVVGNAAVEAEVDDDGNKAEDADSKDYHLMNVEEIDTSKEVVLATSAQAQQLAESIASIVPQRVEITLSDGGHQLKEADYFDRLLVKLKTSLAEVTSRESAQQSSTFDKLPRWRTLADSCEPLEYGETSLFVYKGDIDASVDISFNTFHYVSFPNPWYIVKALTLTKAADIFNLEQLETVGDAFLKMSTAMYLYFKYLNYDEGKLSQLKTALVCNENLYHLAVEAGLPRFANGLQLVVGQNWLMPYLVPAPGQGLFPGERYNKDQVLKYKQVADLVEALMGACLVYGSAGSALAFFNSIGLKVFDPTAFKEDVNPVRYYQEEMDKNFKGIEAKFKDAADRELFEKYRIDLAKMVEDSYQHGKLKQVETAVGYTFKHKYFLVQAFTHPSYTEVDSQTVNYISSFQRLEFIGDAVLDYLFTYFVYQKNQKLLPEAITNLRSSLVNNVFYASIVIKYNLHTTLRCSSPTLQASIAQYVKRYKCGKYEQLGALINDAHFTEVLLKADGFASLHYADDVEVPKALADIFEALIGAIYIDNGFDLDALWRVVYRLIKVEVDYFSENIPVNPISWLEKHYLRRYTFENLTTISENTKSIELRVKSAKGTIEDVYIGNGKTKKMCKVSAAQRFMRDMKKKAALREGVAQSDDSTSVSTLPSESSNSSSESSSSETE